MRIENFPLEIQEYLKPFHKAKMIYRCLGCESEFGIDQLLYICPECGAVLLLHDENFEDLKKIPGQTWQKIFDYRKMLKIPAMKGIYLFHELIGPVIPLEHIIYLGEAHTPIVEASAALQERVGFKFYFKNDGQNPSASFKDRGMASALSYINFLVGTGRVEDVLAICASTGDTSAAAALYASYVSRDVKSAVLLPHGKVTPQQLAQPLGSGARVFEIPGLFDDCMKVVEALSENYSVALLNSKNAWRILGQESYSYEIAMDFEFDVEKLAVFVPIGNAGNITAVMNGFMKFLEIGAISSLPKIIGVQSEHADPVYKYYLETDPAKRKFMPVAVRPSAAQAAMIGNPVSMPRVIKLADRYNEISKKRNVFVVQTTEQDIMDWYLTANQNGHIACTHGGECLAGAVKAAEESILSSDEIAVLDSTAHALKFANFQNMYFDGTMPKDYGVTQNPELINKPELIRPDLEKLPGPDSPLNDADMTKFVDRVSIEIAKRLGIEEKK